MRFAKGLVLLAILAWAQVCFAQRQMGIRPLPPTTPSREKVAPAASETDVDKSSDAERVSRIQKGIDDTGAQLTQLREGMSDPKGEYKKAEAEFSDLDGQFEAAKKEIQRLRAEGSVDVSAKEAALADLEKRRTLAKERFDLAIRERKGTQDKIALLEQKLQQDKDALNKLLGVPEAKQAAPAPENKEAALPSATGTPAESAGAAPVAKAPENSPPAQPVAGPAGGPPADIVAIVNPLGTAPQASPTATAPSPSAGPTKPPSEKIVKAEETASSKQFEADKAKQEAQSITQRLESLRKVIETERELRRNAQKKLNNSEETLTTLNREHNKKWSEGGLPYASPELVELRKAIADAEVRLHEAKVEVQDRGDTLDARQSEFAGLQAEQIAALEDAKKKMEAAQAAQAALAELKNPFAPANIWNWLVLHGSRIGATILSAMILLWLIQVMEHRIVRLITRHGVAGTQEDRESRAQTLAGVLQNLFTVLVIIGAFLLVVAELGFNITTLLGATAIFGLAVAFGAQNLIRDYFYGFMILMENQYLVNDVVRLGAISGQVERITLRITVLRDLRGTVHFVPHGQITTVSNLTRGWARVVLDVGVAYKEDVDRVMKVLADLGKEIRRDPAYRDLILDEPEISGVDALGDSGVIVRFLIKTRPLKQWAIKREMLRRIKNKFDEVGIEIPFPHQVVINRFDENAAEQARLLASPRAEEVEEWTTQKSAAS